MEITTPRDGEISIDDNKEFVEVQTAAAGERKAAAYRIEGPENHIVGIDEGTPVAPEFRDSNGNKLDGSVRLTIQKCDKQGNPIGSGIAFSELLSRFNYQKMRNDPDYFRKMESGLMVDEYEIVKVFLDIPKGANDFDPEQSTLTIGDETSDFGKAVEIVNHDNLSAAESESVKKAAQSGGA